MVGIDVICIMDTVKYETEVLDGGHILLGNYMKIMSLYNMQITEHGLTDACARATASMAHSCLVCSQFSSPSTPYLWNSPKGAGPGSMLPFVSPLSCGYFSSWHVIGRFH